jgi:hypothetical protein
LLNIQQRQKAGCFLNVQYRACPAGHYHNPHTVAGSRITYVGSPYQGAALCEFTVLDFAFAFLLPSSRVAGLQSSAGCI